jgi:hypothetical protein
MSRYEDEARRLSTLPRAERFEQLLSFPTDHTFTVIGRRSGFAEALKQGITDYQSIRRIVNAYLSSPSSVSSAVLNP